MLDGLIKEVIAPYHMDSISKNEVKIKRLSTQMDFFKRMAENSSTPEMAEKYQMKYLTALGELRALTIKAG